MTSPPVVIVGLDCTTGLQAARVFAARGVEVIGIVTNPHHPCVRTRACRRVLTATAGPEGVVEPLMSLGPELEDRAVLIPCSDLAVLGVVRHQRELADHYRMAMPAPEVVEALMDKARFAEFAERYGLPVPTTRVVKSRGDVEAAGEEMTFPCVLKPSLKTVAWDRHVPAKAFVVDSPGALLALYDLHGRWAETFVIQEWVEGADTDHYTCDCYITSSGEPAVTFCSRKLRQWPPVVGQACLSVEHRNDVVRDEALRLLALAGHQGQGYVEMKWDARTGRHVIIEANVGRPTGRSAAAEKAGVELLMTVYRDLIGGPLPPERVQRFRGGKWMHMRRDLQACAYLLWGRGITIAEIARSWRGPFAFALFSIRDPIPFLADIVGAIRTNLPSRIRSRRRTPAAQDPARVAEQDPEEDAEQDASEPVPPLEPDNDRPDAAAIPAPPRRRRRSNPPIALAITGVGLWALRLASTVDLLIFMRG